MCDEEGQRHRERISASVVNGKEPLRTVRDSHSSRKALLTGRMVERQLGATSVRKNPLHVARSVRDCAQDADLQ